MQLGPAVPFRAATSAPPAGCGIIAGWSRWPGRVLQPQVVTATVGARRGRSRGTRRSRRRGRPAGAASGGSFPRSRGGATGRLRDHRPRRPGDGPARRCGLVVHRPRGGLGAGFPPLQRHVGGVLLGRDHGAGRGHLRLRRRRRPRRLPRPGPDAGPRPHAGTGPGGAPGRTTPHRPALSQRPGVHADAPAPCASPTSPGERPGVRPTAGGGDRDFDATADRRHRIGLGDNPSSATTATGRSPMSPRAPA